MHYMTSCRCCVLQKAAELKHPSDRYGKTVTDRWTNAQLNAAQQQYREAVEAASKAVCGAGGAQEWGGMGRGDVG